MYIQIVRQQSWLYGWGGYFGKGPLLNIRIASRQMLYAEVEVLRAIVDKILILMLMLLLTKVGVEGMVELSPEEVVVLGEGDQAELECKVIASSMC